MRTERSYFTTGDGCRIAYRIDGRDARPTLVLSNSIATTLEMWEGEVPELARHFRVLRYDTRGHGGSGAPAGAYSLDRLGRDILELLDALGIERASFLGLSLGGFVGQWLGIHAPERIDRLVLAHTSSHLGPAPSFDRQIAAVLRGEDVTETFIRNWFPPELRAQAAIVEPFREMIRSTRAVGLAGCLAAVRDADLRRTVALIRAPTLVIAGRNDTVTLASHGELLAATVPGAKIEILPAVHLSNVEQRARFLAIVLGFLA